MGNLANLTKKVNPGPSIWEASSILSIVFYYSVNAKYILVTRAVPIVSFGDSDITTLAKDRAYAQIQLDELSIRQVIDKRIYALQENIAFASICLEICLIFFLKFA